MNFFHYYMSMMSKNFDKVGNKKPDKAYLRYILIKHNITQTEIAKRFNVSNAYISRILSGERYREDIINFIIKLGA